ncbi:hypothetical protein [Helicobacter trogontum]|nr:hypothetical protein [Helicobacter trogontum]
MMLFLLIIIIVAVLILTLLNMQQINKTFKKDKEIHLVQCVKCGIYATQADMKKKNGRNYCRECL